MEINYNLSLQDFIDYNTEAAKNDSVNSNVGTFLGYCIAAAVVVDFLFAVAVGWIPFNVVIILLNIALRFFIASAVMVGLSRYFQWVAKKKVLQISENSNGLLCEHRIIINENELIEVTDVNTSYYSWTTVGEVTCTGKFVSIPINVSTVYAIPFSAFTDEFQRNTFIETANYYRKSAQQRFNPSHLAMFDSGNESERQAIGS